MATPEPHVVVIAGPNGAGKSTGAPNILTGALAVDEFVNADVIARGLSEFHPERAAMEAGRVMLDRVHQLADQRTNFAFETTLASRTFVPWITRLRQTGYVFYLIFLWLPAPEMALTRVLYRVHSGGHNVPEETVRRRYQAGIDNFFNLYRPIADRWRFYDSSEPLAPRLLAAGCGELEDTIADKDLWRKIQQTRSAGT